MVKATPRFSNHKLSEGTFYMQSGVIKLSHKPVYTTLKSIFGKVVRVPILSVPY